MQVFDVQSCFSSAIICSAIFLQCNSLKCHPLQENISEERGSAWRWRAHHPVIAEAPFIRRPLLPASRGFRVARCVVATQLQKCKGRQRRRAPQWRSTVPASAGGAHVCGAPCMATRRIAAVSHMPKWDLCVDRSSFPASVIPFTMWRLYCSIYKQIPTAGEA